MIKKVNSLENAIDEQKLSIGVVQWYELIASIAYWYKRGYNTEEKIIEKFMLPSLNLQSSKPRRVI